MKMFRRAVLAAALATAALAQAPALAQTWPDKPIRIVTPFAAGGLANNLARVLADGLTQRLGQAVIVEPKPGGGGVIAFQAVKNAPPDGYTLLLGTNSTLTLLPLMQKNLPFDGLKDFELVAITFVGGNVIVVREDSPIKTFADLRAQSRAKPNTLTYGSAGNGTTFHLMPAMFDRLNGSSMVHVPYRGGSPAFMGLLAGETSLIFGNTDSLPFVKAGKLRPIAAMSSKRLSYLPDVPTTAELGMPELVMESFYGLLAPAGTPKPIVDRINREVTELLATPTVRKQLETLAIDPAGNTSPAYFRQQIQAELARWRPVITDANITAE